MEVCIFQWHYHAAQQTLDIQREQRFPVAKCVTTLPLVYQDDHTQFETGWNGFEADDGGMDLQNPGLQGILCYTLDALDWDYQICWT